MINHFLKLKFTYLFLGIFIVSFGLFTISKKIIAATNPNFQLQIIIVCGNNVKDPGEQCDGVDLGGFTCSDRGFSGGSLLCTSLCTFDVSACTNSHHEISKTSVIFEGLAYPNSIVTLLKDGQIVATTIADSDANFQINVSDISDGDYRYIFYAEDGDGNRSSTSAFSDSVITGGSNNIRGIFLAPTILLDKSEVKLDSNVIISGQTVPQADVLISISSISEEVFFVKIKANTEGKYAYSFYPSALKIGQYFVKSKSFLNNEVSFYSSIINFNVGSEDIIIVPGVKCPAKGDLNNDCRVDLTDFSIAAYWYKKPLSVIFKILEEEKLNGDGIISIVDFSVIAFYWTG